VWSDRCPLRAAASRIPEAGSFGASVFHHLFSPHLQPEHFGAAYLAPTTNGDRGSWRQDGSSGAHNSLRRTRNWACSVIPRRTWCPQIATTVTRIASPMIICSPILRLKTNIVLTPLRNLYGTPQNCSGCIHRLTYRIRKPHPNGDAANAVGRPIVT